MQQRGAAIMAICLAGWPGLAMAQSCPEPLASATRLILVTADGMTTKLATVTRFERARPGEGWRAVGAPQEALIGKRGMAWAHAFRALARPGEPVKIDGDKRVPAGIYRIGASFGFAASSRPNYLQIKQGTVCVDDLASPAYNTITTRAAVGASVHGENMWRVPAYRHGLLVDYPTDRRARAGSCIFIHLRLPEATGTAGCVALPESELVDLQEFSAPGAVMAVLPEGARSRLSGCLPN